MYDWSAVVGTSSIGFTLIWTLDVLLSTVPSLAIKVKLSIPLKFKVGL